MSGNEEIDVVAGCSTDLAVRHVQRLKPNAIVLDATGPSALALARFLKAHASGLNVVVVTSARDGAEFPTWAEAGVNAYADQNSSAAEFVDVVRHAVRGEVLRSPRLASMDRSRTELPSSPLKVQDALNSTRSHRASATYWLWSLRVY